MHAFVCLCTCAHLRVHCKMQSVNKIMIINEHTKFNLCLAILCSLLYFCMNYGISMLQCALTHLKQCSGILISILRL